MKFLKNPVFMFILGVVTCTITTVLASSLIANNISYTPQDKTWGVTNVGAALDSLMLSKTSDNYSTEERVVGTWTDGKPLYQKTIIIDVPTAQVEGTDATSIVTVSQNVDTFCHHNAQILIDRANGEVIYFGEYANTGDSGYRNVTYTKTSSNVLQVTLHNKFVSWHGKMIVTVQYTKTTD